MPVNKLFGAYATANGDNPMGDPEVSAQTAAVGIGSVASVD
jgi:hypothetical protein